MRRISGFTTEAAETRRAEGMEDREPQIAPQSAFLDHRGEETLSFAMVSLMFRVSVPTPAFSLSRASGDRLERFVRRIISPGPNCKSLLWAPHCPPLVAPDRRRIRAAFSGSGGVSLLSERRPHRTEDAQRIRVRWRDVVGVESYSILPSPAPPHSARLPPLLGRSRMARCTATAVLDPPLPSGSVPP